MIVKVISQDIAYYELKKYAKSLSGKRINKTVYKSILNSAKMLQEDIEDEVYYVKGETAEVYLVLKDYIKYLSHYHYLAILVFIDNLVSIYSVEDMKRICEYSDYYSIFPTKTNDSLISLYIAFYNNNKTKDLDVDLSLRSLFN